jgi:hypothetical protein
MLAAIAGAEYWIACVASHPYIAMFLMLSTILESGYMLAKIWRLLGSRNFGIVIPPRNIVGKAIMFAIAVAASDVLMNGAIINPRPIVHIAPTRRRRAVAIHM